MDFIKKAINSDIFGRLLKNEGLFVDREAMRPTYMPDILPHRSNEINDIASVLVPALRGETPSNIFIYGKTGTGKTAVTKFVGKELLKKGEQTGKSVNFIYINCEVVDTQYRLLQNIANHFISDWSERIPFTGWPTDEVYNKLIKMIENNAGVTVITGIVQEVLNSAATTQRPILQLDSIVVNAPLVADIPSNDKNNRLLPDVTFTALYQGAIHKVQISGTISV